MILLNKYTHIAILLVSALIVSGVGYWYIQNLEPTFEEELQYYVEWTKENPSSGGGGEWVFRDYRTEGIRVAINYPQRPNIWVNITSWEDYKTYYESLNDTETLEHEIVKASNKELRKIVRTWKAVYIEYDPVSKVIWSYALHFGPSFGLEEGKERWVLYYWEAPA